MHLHPTTTFQTADIYCRTLNNSDLKEYMKQVNVLVEHLGIHLFPDDNWVLLAWNKTLENTTSEI